MAKAKTSRRALTVEKIAAKETKERVSLARDIGVPDAQIVNRGLTTHPTYDSDTGKKIGKTIRILYPTVVDRWLAEGGPGFEEPQRRAVEHCRSLWACLGSRRLVANYDGVGGGSDGNGEREQHALDQLYEYRKDFPAHVWDIFENIVRHDFSIGQATVGLSANKSQNQGYVRACVGFVASKISEWRGY